MCNYQTVRWWMPSVKAGFKRGRFATCSMLLLASLLLFSGPSLAHRVWLIIGASDTRPSALIKKANVLQARQQGGIVLATKDCGNKPNVYAWSAPPESSEQSARVILEEVRRFSPQAYVKPCDVLAASLLAWGIPAIDPSIAQVPISVVNWEDGEKISRAWTSSSGVKIVQVRMYSESPNDPLEGRREKILMLQSENKTVILAEHCTNFQMGNSRDAIAFHCVVGATGDKLLYRSYVFTDQGQKLGQVENCRLPNYTLGKITCTETLVDAEGRTKQYIKTLTLAK
jgi:hypothetical protein